MPSGPQLPQRERLSRSVMRFTGRSTRGGLGMHQGHQPAAQFGGQPVAQAARQVLGPARDMDFGPLAPHRAAHLAAVADAVRLAEQREVGAVGERTPRRQALQPRRDPSGLRFGEAQGGAARHAQRRREHDAPPRRIDPQRGAARACTADEGDGQGIAGMSNGQLLGPGHRFRQDETKHGAGQRHEPNHTTADVLT